MHTVLPSTTERGVVGSLPITAIGGLPVAPGQAEGIRYGHPASSHGLTVSTTFTYLTVRPRSV